jgi:hypothetical protein
MGVLIEETCKEVLFRNGNQARPFTAEESPFPRCLFFIFFPSNVCVPSNGVFIGGEQLSLRCLTWRSYWTPPRTIRSRAVRLFKTFPPPTSYKGLEILENHPSQQTRDIFSTKTSTQALPSDEKLRAQPPYRDYSKRILEDPSSTSSIISAISAPWWAVRYSYIKFTDIMEGWGAQVRKREMKRNKSMVQSSHVESRTRSESDRQRQKWSNELDRKAIRISCCPSDRAHRSQDLFFFEFLYYIEIISKTSRFSFLARG